MSAVQPGLTSRAETNVSLYHRPSAMRRIEINHTTTYEYPEPVTFLKHRLLVRPREGHDIRIEASRLEISPEYSIRWYRDVYNNSVAAVDFAAPADRLTIKSQVIVQHYEPRPVPLVLADEARVFPFHYDPMEQIDLMIYLLSAYPQDSVRVGQWLRAIWSPGTGLPTLDLLDAINRKIVGEIGYEVRERVGVQSPAETLARGKGSCRDVATLFIEACRHCGLASRFVSGYLLSSAAVEDVASTHAWSEVYLPAGGWRGFDSTSAQHVGGEHVAVAVHRHPEAVPPIAGAYLGPEEPKPVMHVEVRATEL
jgi:transglutaminase-like putative cysteine protease